MTFTGVQVWKSAVDRFKNCLLLTWQIIDVTSVDQIGLGHRVRHGGEDATHRHTGTDILSSASWTTDKAKQERGRNKIQDSTRASQGRDWNGVAGFGTAERAECAKEFCLIFFFFFSFRPHALEKLFCDTFGTKEFSISQFIALQSASAVRGSLMWS